MTICIKNLVVLFIAVACCVQAERCLAQTDSVSLQISGYAETFYSYDFGRPFNHNRPGFIYSYNRHNEVNINLGFIKVNYQKNRLRSNLALMAGTYVNANLAAEPGVLKNIFEANIGIKLSNKKNLWLDAGIFPSHIGFESAIGKDCWALTRSILAENSPYYESGAKLTYITNDGQWTISGLLLNGWQRIQRVDGNNTPAFGHQLTYKPSSTITFNSSSFIGNDKADSVRQMRYFHNFYLQWQMSKRLGIIVGLDVGAEQKNKGSHEYNMWYAPILLFKVTTGKHSNLTARLEYFTDESGVIISTASPNGFKTMGYSLNYDISVQDNVMWRVEARALSSKDKIFYHGETAANTNYTITTCMAISF